MQLRTQVAFAALAFAFTGAAAAPAVFAQNRPPAQAGQDHQAHHPDGKTTAPPAGAPRMGGGGMMGQDGMMGGGMMCSDMKQMMSMMQDMHAMMMPESGMMASRTEARIAKLKADLKIADAQAAPWNGFADALRQFAKSMDENHRQRAMSGDALPARLAAAEKAMEGNLKSMKALEDALKPLYAALSDEQKKIADGLKFGPMGLM